MAEKQKSNVDIWLESETKHNREALENASRYFDTIDIIEGKSCKGILF